MWFAFRFIDCNKLLDFELFIYLYHAANPWKCYIYIYEVKYELFVDIHSTF